MLMAFPSSSPPPVSVLAWLRPMLSGLFVSDISGVGMGFPLLLCLCTSLRGCGALLLPLSSQTSPFFFQGGFGEGDPFVLAYSSTGGQLPLYSPIYLFLQFIRVLSPVVCLTPLTSLFILVVLSWGQFISFLFHQASGGLSQCLCSFVSLSSLFPSHGNYTAFTSYFYLSSGDCGNHLCL